MTNETGPISQIVHLNSMSPMSISVSRSAIVHWSVVHHVSWSTMSTGPSYQLVCYVHWFMMSVGLPCSLIHHVSWSAMSIGPSCQLVCHVHWFIMSVGLSCPLVHHVSWSSMPGMTETPSFSVWPIQTDMEAVLAAAHLLLYIARIGACLGNLSQQLHIFHNIHHTLVSKCQMAYYPSLQCLLFPYFVPSMEQKAEQTHTLCYGWIDREI